MKVAFKSLIEPNKIQEDKLFKTLKILRHYYNFSLDQRIRHYSAYGKGLSKTIQENMLPLLKETVEFGDLGSIHSHLPQDALSRLDDAYDRFFKRLSGFPKFKSSEHYNSFTYKQPKGMKPFKKEGFIYLSKIGLVKFNPHRKFNADTMSTLTIKHEGGKWYAIVICEVDELNKLDVPVSQIGIDVGIKSFIALSDGTFVENPKYLRKSEEQLVRLQRSLSRKKIGSNNRGKAKKKLAKLHLKIKNQRRDFLHKVSKMLTDKFDLVVAESLKIKNMMKNHKLAKSISDAGWGTFLEYVKYKAQRKGKLFDKVSANGTSQTCICGAKVPKTLKDRVHNCPSCGAVMDRDTMSAKVILRRSQYALNCN